MIKNKDILKPISFIIISFVLLVILVNVFSQIYFSPERVQKYLDQTLDEDEPVLIDFNKAQLSFSGSLSPFFAIKITQVKLSHDRCHESYELKSPYLLVPFSIIKAFNNKLSLGYIKAGKIEFSITNTDEICADGANENRPLLEKIRNIQTEKNYSNVFTKVQNVFKNIRGFRLANLILKHTKKEKVKITEIQNIRISYNKKNQSIYTYNEFEFLPNNFEIPGTVTKKGVNLIIKSTISKKEGFSFQVNARHLEGTFEIKSRPQISINNYKVEAQVNNLPLTFLSYITDNSFLKTINSHRVWHNSNLVINLNNFFSEDKTTVTAKVSNLEFFGPVFKAQSANFALQIYPEIKILKTIEWRLDNLNLNGLIAKDRLSKARGVIDQFGILKGSGKVQTNGELMFEGILKNSSFVFSMNGKKASQVLNQANIIVNTEYPSINVQMENVVLDKGLFDGDIKAKVTLSDDISWMIDVSSESLNFSNKVQKLFEIEQTPFENLNFKLIGQNRNLNSLSFSAQLEQLKTKWGQFQNSDYKINYIPDGKNFIFNIISQQFILDSSFLKIDLIDSNKILRNLNTELKLSEMNKSFNLEAKTTSPPVINLLAEGADYNKDFLASVSVGQSNFVIEGQINKGFNIKSVQ